MTTGLPWDKVEVINEKDAIFHELIEECRFAPVTAPFSTRLRHRLEKFDVQTRSEIVNRSKVGCSPLFIACLQGKLEMVEYLINVCNADMEQTGIYEVQDERTVHVVTPLWCAAVAGRISVVKKLLALGANVNAVSDTGSTPVRSACFMTHGGIVRLLVENGADINKPNYNGGTCLINSVQSASLCEYLLDHGADINARDIQYKTALHYAIQEHRLETTQVLLKYGADYTAKSKYGDDALQMCCLKAATRIFNYLITNLNYTPEQIADAHELIGATFLDEHNDMVTALSHWRKATDLRESQGILPKKPIMPPREAYRMQSEFQNSQELETIALDADAMKLHSLMIAERVLGPHHKDTIFRLMFRGAYNADIRRYQRCIDLWRRALEIRVEKDTILFQDTSFTAQALVKLMIEYYDCSIREALANSIQRFHDVLEVFKLLTKDIEEMIQLIRIRPYFQKHGETFDEILKCITHLISLMHDTAATEDETRRVYTLVTDLVKINPRNYETGDTLLHLCMRSDNIIKSTYFIHDHSRSFPHYGATEVLLKCGAPVNQENNEGASPLLLAVQVFNYQNWLVDLLLEYGAHLDQPNREGKTPMAVMLSETHNSPDFKKIDFVSHITLKCLCATVISKFKIPYRNQVPKTLIDFIKMHER